LLKGVVLILGMFLPLFCIYPCAFVHTVEWAHG